MLSMCFWIVKWQTNNIFQGLITQTVLSERPAIKLMKTVNSNENLKY